MKKISKEKNSSIENSRSQNLFFKKITALLTSKPGLVIIIVILITALGFSIRNISKLSVKPAPYSLRQFTSLNQKKCDILVNNQKPKPGQDFIGGTVYADQGVVRADFIIPGPQGATTEHVLLQGARAFMWLDGLRQGFITPLSKTDDPTITNIQQSFRLDTYIDYSCSDWKPDQTILNAPLDISFIDVQAQIQADKNK